MKSTNKVLKTHINAIKNNDFEEIIKTVWKDTIQTTELETALKLYDAAIAAGYSFKNSWDCNPTVEGSFFYKVRKWRFHFNAITKSFNLEISMMTK